MILQPFTDERKALKADPARSHFEPARFKEMSDAERLSKPHYAPLGPGIDLKRVAPAKFAILSAGIALLHACH